MSPARPIVAALGLLVACTLTCVGAPPAAAAPTGAHATLALSGAAGRALSAAGVTVTAHRRATVAKRIVTLPVTVAVVGTTAAVGLDGTVVFRAGKRRLSLTALRLTVSARRAVQITASVAGERIPVLVGTATARALALDRFRSTAAIGPTRLTVTERLGTRLRTALRLRRAPAGALGPLTLVAATTASTTTTPTTPPGAPTPTATTPSPGSTTTTPAPKVCEPTAPATTPASETGWDLAPPPAAVAVTSACIVWHPRDSWTNYVNTGEGAMASAGATADPPNTACGDSPLPRTFRFQFHRGWLDPTTGQAVLQYDGSVRYRYSAHGIDLTFANPEVQLGGATSQATFRSGPAPGGRSPVLTLDPSAPWPAQCASDPGPQGSTGPTGGRTYERLHATVAAGAAALFDSGGLGGSYPPGADFGWLSVSFTSSP